MLWSSVMKFVKTTLNSLNLWFGISILVNASFWSWNTNTAFERGRLLLSEDLRIVASYRACTFVEIILFLWLYLQSARVPKRLATSIQCGHAVLLLYFHFCVVAFCSTTVYILCPVILSNPVCNSKSIIHNK